MYSFSYHPAPMPQSRRPPLITSIVEVILASTLGLPVAVAADHLAEANRVVSWLIAAIVVQHSNTASPAGRGTLWKWSYTQIES